MKKKSLITMVVSLALVAIIGVGSTLAYLSSTSEQVTNTFTVGNVSIKLDETNINDPDGPRVTSNRYENMYPGQVVKKDPAVTINEDSADCYVFMKVKGLTALEGKGFTILKDDGENNGVNDSWVKIDGTDDLDGTYVYRGGETTGVKVDKSGKLPALFGNVKYNDIEKGGLEESNIPKVYVVACAVQAEGIDLKTAYDNVPEDFENFKIEEN